MRELIRDKSVQSSFVQVPLVQRKVVLVGLNLTCWVGQIDQLKEHIDSN